MITFSSKNGKTCSFLLFHVTDWRFSINVSVGNAKIITNAELVPILANIYGKLEIYHGGEFINFYDEREK